jgi:hypothetical protein
MIFDVIWLRSDNASEAHNDQIYIKFTLMFHFKNFHTLSRSFIPVTDDICNKWSRIIEHYRTTFIAAKKKALVHWVSLN